MGKIAVVVCLMFAAHAWASTTQTIGEGSAVLRTDHRVSFGGLDYLHNGSPLSDYRESGIFVRTSGDSFSGWGPGHTPAFNPFHIPMDPATQAFYFPDGGTNDWVLVETAAGSRMFALEFRYGNGWTTGDIYGVPWGNDLAWLAWRTYRGNTLVSQGQVGPNPLMPVGTIIGFYDPDGFDRIEMRCHAPNQADPTLQALALDDLSVQTTSFVSIRGHVDLGNYPADPTGIPIVLELRHAISKTIEAVYTLELDALGDFQALTPLTGGYDLLVKADHWLRRAVPNVTISPPGIEGLNFVLLNGDINGDNSINSDDFDLLVQDFGTTGPTADLDGNGWVDSDDFDILVLNFGGEGD